MVSSDDLHRTVKLAIDSGEVATLDEAKRLFEGYRLTVAAGPDVAASPTLQAALLTAVNTACRCFLGGVVINGPIDVGLLAPWPGDECSLTNAVAALGGRLGEDPSPTAPVIAIGDARPVATEGIAVRATFDGWAGGVIPLDEEKRLAERQECPPAGVLAGALAVSEAFQSVRGGNAAAGRRAVGLSLWRPESTVDWLSEAGRGPELAHLPSRAWLIGLGHLGQAVLWTLGFLPYARPEEVLLVLQDTDTLVRANDSTSLLTRSGMGGQKKTRAMARWAEARGFRTVIQERRFAGNFQVNDEEPWVAICGVDNALARAALEDVGFARVIEAGLGAGNQEYLAFQIHTFPARGAARDRWRAGYHGAPDTTALLTQPAYQSLATDGLDACGLTQLAGRTVGAPFVGAAVSSLVVAELLRLGLGDQRYELIDGTLRSLGRRQAIPTELLLEPFNPGTTPAQRVDFVSLAHDCYSRAIRRRESLR